MTRKEPRFNDDLNSPISVPDPRESVRSDVKPDMPRPQKTEQSNRTGSNWLLWLFVVVSLSVSFGVAFLGLEEAGRYQASLSQAESQAKKLEATIQRLNDSQVQGIGELAQSDAQMRKMVQSVEARLKSDVTKDLEALSKQVKSLQETAKESELKQVQALQLAARNTEASSKAVQSKLDESVALLSKQINTERTRIDAVSGTRKAVLALSEELRSLQDGLVTLDGRLQEVSTDQVATAQAVKDIQLVVEGINEQLAQRATADNALIGLEILSEQVDRLTQQTKQQQQVIDAVDASRKQLTQRIIDLDGRVNLALSPKEQ